MEDCLKLQSILLHYSMICAEGNSSAPVYTGIEGKDPHAAEYASWYDPKRPKADLPPWREANQPVQSSAAQVRRHAGGIRFQGCTLP